MWSEPPTEANVYVKRDLGMRAGTEKGPCEGALCIRKDVPPAKFPFTGPSVLKPYGSMSAIKFRDSSLSRDTNTRFRRRLQ